MRAPLRLLLATTLAVFAHSVIGQTVPRGTVYFLNVPESVRRPGIVMNQVLRPSERARIFWHYKNDTGREQLFVLTSEGDARNLRTGFAVSSSPSAAGTAAMLQFQHSDPSEKPLRLEVRARVGRGQTISGVAEGVWGQSSTLVAQMGEGKELHGIVRIISPFLFVEERCHVSAGQMGRIRVGESRPGRIAGDYGSTIRVTAIYHGKKHGKVRISFSPRGGPLILVYRYNGKVRQSQRVRAKGEQRLVDVWLKPGELVSLDIYPLGGFNYPVELRCRVIA
jgi:hypothetical protein